MLWIANEQLDRISQEIQENNRAATAIQTFWRGSVGRRGGAAYFVAVNSCTPTWAGRAAGPTMGDVGDDVRDKFQRIVEFNRTELVNQKRAHGLQLVGLG